MADKIKIAARGTSAKAFLPPNAQGSKRGAVSVANLAADVTTIDFYGPVGGWDGITAADFKRTLNGITSPTIVLNINSPGGDVFEGVAIHNDLVAHAATVEVHVTGIAASIASVIAMAGDTVTVEDGAFFMIHNAWTIALGDNREMSKTADTLKKIDGSIAQAYAKRTGLDVAEVSAMMDDETWLDAAQAVDLGFADKIAPVDAAKAKALGGFSLNAFRHVPAALLNGRAAPAAPPIPQHSEGAAALIEALRRAESALK